ncbi:hypothetical protein [Sandarakinorhabdus sp. AAP62]|nr:hypothetical protein [Sandarakinorhabdus sp. AAP62]
MPNGSHLSRNQHGPQLVRRVWLWLGLTLGTAGGALTGWLIGG